MGCNAHTHTHRALSHSLTLLLTLTHSLPPLALICVYQGRDVTGSYRWPYAGSSGCPCRRCNASGTCSPRGGSHFCFSFSHGVCFFLGAGARNCKASSTGKIYAFVAAAHLVVDSYYWLYYVFFTIPLLSFTLYPTNPSFFSTRMCGVPGSFLFMWSPWWSSPALAWKKCLLCRLGLKALR